MIAGFASLTEFLFATPAIAFALGSYVHFLYPGVEVLWTAIACYVLFSLINFWGIRESAAFTLGVTILAVAELLLFMGVVAPHFRLDNFMRDSMPQGYLGVFAALPFAIWFYLAIEGVAMVAEESKDPQRTIPLGYISGIATLALLALGVMVLSGGITDWHRLADIDYPLPEAIGIVMGKDSSLTKLFAGIGLFGLVASFHSIILSYSRQLFALARAGYLPRRLAHLHPRFHTPDVALLVGGLIGIVAICSGTTQQLIVLSALGAVLMYAVSMLSLLVLRRKEPKLERPFKAPFYPVFPLIALVLSLICLLAIVVYNFWLSVLFFGLLLVLLLGYVGMGMHRQTDLPD
jgi:ethanolamine permease